MMSTLNTVDLNALVRPNIRSLKPYSSARDEFKGEASVFLDANENSLGSASEELYNRYPDPLQWTLKHKIGTLKNVAAENIFIGNGSDEPIDLLFRVFCMPGVDNVVTLPPTYGMYEVAANINDVECRTVQLTSNFQPDVDGIRATCDDKTKLLFICSPNNPTGNSIDEESIKQLIVNFPGIVVLDEAYIDFSTQKSFLANLEAYPRLVILQTFSKAWGLAALRAGMAFAGAEIISLLNRVKAPYNINACTQELLLQAIDRKGKVDNYIEVILAERSRLEKALQEFSFVKKVYPSDANFLLVGVENVLQTYTYLVNEGIIVRNRSSLSLCENCIRITVGTAEENNKLLKALEQFQLKS